MPDVIFRSDEEVEAVLRGFESCELPPANFDHARHLAVALVLLAQLGEERAAAARVREGLKRYIAAHGVDPRKYHETVTVFWVKRVRAFAERAGRGRALAELANELARECGDPRLVYDYYSKALVDTEEARTRWVEPDLRAFDF
jgi:hypothetical protein